jgi:hypothetical protein
MVEGAGRQAELAVELSEWWEDLWQRHTGSRVVMVRVPPGWGRTTALNQFAAKIAGREDAPVTLTIWIQSQAVRALETAGLRSRELARTLQAQVLEADLGEAAEQHRWVHQRGLDKPAGLVQLGLGVAGLFVPGLPAGISFLLAGLETGAAGKKWDDSPAGLDGALARTARAVAKVSVEAPVTVIIDDADCLDEDFAVTLVENLTARQDSQVLIIAVVDPSSPLRKAIRSRVRQGLTSGLVHDAEAKPGMDYGSRLELARQLLPDLPEAGARRIAQRTATFAEVFTVAAAPKLAEIGPDQDEDAVRAEADAAAGARLTRPAPSLEATVIAWAKGVVHAQQADRALGILETMHIAGDPDVRRSQSLARLAGPVTPRLADQVRSGLTGVQRGDLAAAFLEEALALAGDPGTGPIGTVAALQAAHRVRADLPAPVQLPRAQRLLVAALEALREHAAALEIADVALDEWPPGAGDPDDRDALSAAKIRLTGTIQAPPGPLAGQLIAEAIEGGAVTGLEARVWAAITLMDTSGPRDAALALAATVIADLDARPDLGEAGDRWRLLLAASTSRAGHPGLAGQLLAPLLASDDPDRHRPARVILDAGDGPRAGIRLQNILLTEQLTALPDDAEDDQLRIHHALAANHATLGEFGKALANAEQELTLRTRIQGPSHPDTLAARDNIARWTGLSGDRAGALRLFQELLPDLEQVKGPCDPHTLATCGNVAHWTGQCGDAAEALRLYRELLPDMEQVLGPRHRDTLAAYDNIARWTGETGDRAEALRLFQELLPDLEQVKGPLDPDTLTARASIAYWTGLCGNPAEALRLYRELLPDRAQALGADHPDTLSVRSSIAILTGQCEGPADALRLYRELLPDLEQALGPRHPTTLDARGSIAYWTGQCGDPAEALRLARELWPDLEQNLDSVSPDTLITLLAIMGLTEGQAAAES